MDASGSEEERSSDSPLFSFGSVTRELLRVFDRGRPAVEMPVCDPALVTHVIREVAGAVGPSRPIAIVQPFRREVAGLWASSLDISTVPRQSPSLSSDSDDSPSRVIPTARRRSPGRADNQSVGEDFRGVQDNADNANRLVPSLVHSES